MAEIKFNLEFNSVQTEKLKEVFTELQRAKDKHPVFPEDDFEKLAIITEEVGELAQALLDFKHKKGDWKHVLEEANQVAAMGLRIRLSLKNK